MSFELPEGVLAEDGANSRRGLPAYLRRELGYRGCGRRRAIKRLGAVQSLEN